MITQAELKEILHYDPDTGIFTRIKSTAPCIKVGDVAGHDNGKGYLQFRINNKYYTCHRLAWLYMYGVFPEGDIDHIDGITKNNRIANLRDVTTIVNCQNHRKPNSNNKSGFLGVFKAKNKYRALINIQGNKTHLGYFDTPEAASCAYLKAKRSYHKGCTI